MMMIFFKQTNPIESERKKNSSIRFEDASHHLASILCYTLAAKITIF